MENNQLIITDMNETHLAEIVRIEKRCFSDPWNLNMFNSELNNGMSVYKVILLNDAVIAYGGYWKIFDEGHIMNIAVDMDFRRNHYSDILMKSLINSAKESDITAMTLEVRKSNSTAISLYEKYGFKEEGIRKGYYEDGEDAVIMWTGI